MAIKNITHFLSPWNFSGKKFCPFWASTAIKVALFDVPLPLRYLDCDWGRNIEPELRGAFWIGDDVGRNWNDCFVIYCMTLEMWGGVKFRVLSLCQNNLPKLSIKRPPLPTNILPNFSSTFKPQEAPNVHPSTKLFIFPSLFCSGSFASFGPPWLVSREKINLALQELKLSPQRVRFASKAAALLFAWAAKAVVEAMVGGWSWLSQERLRKRGILQKGGEE